MSLFEKLPPLDLRTIPDRATVTELDLRRHDTIEHLEDLPHFTQLQTLRFGTSPVFTNLAPIAALTQLRSLRLDSQRQLPITALATLTHLEILELRWWPHLTDLQPLASLTKLRTLDLTGAYFLEDIRPLAALTQLTRLHLSGSSLLTDLTPIAYLTRLQFLDLSINEQLQDLTPVANLHQLEVVLLHHSRQIANLRPLAHLPHLKKLSLDDCWRIQPKVRAAIETEDWPLFRDLLKTSFPNSSP